MKTLFTLSIIFCFAVLGYPQDQKASNTVKQEVLEISKRDLASFLTNIPEGFEKQHGFNNRSEFKMAVPGSVYKIWGVDASGEVFSTNLYNVSVAVNGEYRAMITVGFENGIYSIETVGASLLAKELQKLEQQKSNSSTSEKLMLNFYDKKCGFVAFENADVNIEMASFTPLASATSVLDENKTPILSSYKLKDLRNILVNN